MAVGLGAILLHFERLFSGMERIGLWFCGIVAISLELLRQRAMLPRLAVRMVRDEGISFQEDRE